jgi:abortive infection bacteriophage resistance protein
MSAIVKPFTTFDEQIAILLSRGMLVPDREFATRWLQSVGYYRLSGYWHTSRQVTEIATDGNKRIPIRSNDFEHGTSFAEIAALYELDRKLRTVIHDGIERLEVALRTAVAHVLAAKDPLALYDRSMFRGSEEKPGGLYHYALLTQITQKVNRAARNGSGEKHITHNVEKYGSQLPTWVVMDVLDFGDVSKIFGALAIDAQTQVASQLGIEIPYDQLTKDQRSNLSKAHPLAPWLRQLSLLRNKSAHHSRVWNCTLAPAGSNVMRKVDGLASLPANQSERVFGCLTVIGKILESTSPGSSWTSKVKNLLTEGIATIPPVSAEALGVTSGWETQGIWCDK